MGLEQNMSNNKIPEIKATLKSFLFQVNALLLLFVILSGLFFANFDAAVIVFENLVRHNVFETTSSLQSLLLTFYVQTFKGQIAKLLGSLDILGNPVGLIQDFTVGMEGLIKKGNVGGLIMNVAHGMSDSAAKVTCRYFCSGCIPYHDSKLEKLF